MFRTRDGQMWRTITTEQNGKVEMWEPFHNFSKCDTKNVAAGGT